MAEAAREIVGAVVEELAIVLYPASPVNLRKMALCKAKGGNMADEKKVFELAPGQAAIVEAAFGADATGIEAKVAPVLKAANVPEDKAGMLKVGLRLIKAAGGLPKGQAVALLAEVGYEPPKVEKIIKAGPGGFPLTEAGELDEAQIPETMRQMVKGLYKAHVESEKKVADLQKAARTEVLQKAIAADCSHLPGDRAELLALLQKADGAGLFDGFMSLLKKASAAMKESGLFREIGSSAGDSGDAKGKVEALVKAKMTADPKLGKGDAWAAVCTEHPELYEELSK